MTDAQTPRVDDGRPTRERSIGGHVAIAGDPELAAASGTARPQVRTVPVSGGSSRRPARREPGRKELIVRAAVDVLSEHGVAGTTHRLVAEAADVPLGSLTYYFSSLADLREQAFRVLAADLSARYAAAFEAVQSRQDLVEAIADLIQRQAGAEDRDMVLVYELYLAAVRDPALRAVTESWMQASRAVLERFVDPVTARGVDALIEGLVMHNTLSTSPLGREDIATIVAKVIGDAHP